MNTFTTCAGISVIEAYEQPGLTQIRLENINATVPAGTDWLNYKNFVVDKSGIQIDPGDAQHNYLIEFAWDHNNVYHIFFTREESIIDNLIVPQRITEEGGISISIIEIPKEAEIIGYDHLRIISTDKEPYNSIGHIRLMDNSVE